MNNQKREKLLTIKQASQVIRIQYRMLLEAVHQRQVPYYQIHRSRKMVLPSEVLSLMRHEAAAIESNNGLLRNTRGVL